MERGTNTLAQCSVHNKCLDIDRSMKNILGLSVVECGSSVLICVEGNCET